MTMLLRNQVLFSMITSLSLIISDNIHINNKEDPISMIEHILMLE